MTQIFKFKVSKETFGKYTIINYHHYVLFSYQLPHSTLFISTASFTRFMVVLNSGHQELFTYPILSNIFLDASLLESKK